MIHNADCMNILPSLDTASVDLVIMDPPYDIPSPMGGGGYCGDRDVFDRIRPLTDGLQSEALDECLRILKRPNLYIWGNWRQIMTLVTRFSDLNRYSVALLSWHKTNPVPTCSNKYLNDTEYCLYIRERGVPLNGGYKDHGTYWVTPCNKADKDRYGHPTIKPLDIIRTMVRNSSNPGDMILDPFMGSGTTGVQCALEGREFIGIEKDPGYFETAERRIHQMEANVKGAWFRPTVPIESFYKPCAFYLMDRTFVQL